MSLMPSAISFLASSSRLIRSTRALSCPLCPDTLICILGGCNGRQAHRLALEFLNREHAATPSPAPYLEAELRESGVHLGHDHGDDVGTLGAAIANIGIDDL